MKTMEFVRQDIWKGQYFCGAGFPSSANEIAKDVSGTYGTAPHGVERQPDRAHRGVGCHGGPEAQQPAGVSPGQDRLEDTAGTADP